MSESKHTIAADTAASSKEESRWSLSKTLPEELDAVLMSVSHRCQGFNRWEDSTTLIWF